MNYTKEQADLLEKYEVDNLRAVAYCWILERIKSGHYPPGSRLPTNKTIREELPVAEGYISNSLWDLRADGYLQPKNGKQASYVAFGTVEETDLTEAIEQNRRDVAELSKLLAEAQELARALAARIERMNSGR